MLYKNIANPITLNKFFKCSYLFFVIPIINNNGPNNNISNRYFILFVSSYFLFPTIIKNKPMKIKLMFIGNFICFIPKYTNIGDNIMNKK